MSLKHLKICASRYQLRHKSLLCITGFLENSLLREISRFVENHAKSPFIKMLFVKEERIVQIQGFHRRLETSVAAFQVWLVRIYLSPSVDIVSRYKLM
jgi:hypothetical protein